MDEYYKLRFKGFCFFSIIATSFVVFFGIEMCKCGAPLTWAILISLLIWCWLHLIIVLMFYSLVCYMLDKLKTFKPKTLMPKRKYRLKGNVKIASLDSLEEINKAIKDLEILKRLIKEMNKPGNVVIDGDRVCKVYIYDDDVPRTVIIEALQTYVDEVEASLSRYIYLK